MTTWFCRRWPRAVALLVVPALMAAACSGGGDDSHPTASSELVTWAEGMCSLVNDADDRERELLVASRQMFVEADSDADKVRVLATFAEAVSNIKRNVAVDLERLNVPSPALELHTQVQTAALDLAIVVEMFAMEIQGSDVEPDLIQALSEFSAQLESQPAPPLSDLPGDVRAALSASQTCQSTFGEELIEILEVHQRSPG